MNSNKDLKNNNNLKLKLMGQSIPNLNEKLAEVEFDYDEIVLVLFNLTKYDRCIKKRKKNDDFGFETDANV